MNRVRSNAAVLVPLGAGVALAALPMVLPLGAGVAVIDLAVLLALGALFRETPWRVGSLVALPVVAAAVLRAGAGSGGAFLVAMLVSPVLVLFYALVARAGAMLVERDTADDDRLHTEAAPAAHPRGRFETKAQRGRFLAILGILAVVGMASLSAWSSSSADRKAARREAEIRQALKGRTPAELTPQVLQAFGGNGEVLPGGPYETVEPGSQMIRATATVRSGIEERCIRVLLSAEGVLSTETSEGRC
ncbi:MAG: hypothetical protein M3P53_05620 [Actinomycetota bacterium]|nr:hypothetical protein [Actinomycetota bacterium]